MRLVIIESPYKGDIERNVAYARSAMLDCLERGESPIASHLLYTQVLDDAILEEREQGIAAGLAWRHVATPIFYTDLGWSDGMKSARWMYDREKIEWEERGNGT